MGDYNINCALTGQVIQDGDPVVIIPIINNTSIFSTSEKNSKDEFINIPWLYNRDSVVSNTRQWIPLDIAILGKYIGYGYSHYDPDSFEQVEALIAFICKHQRLKPQINSDDQKLLTEWMSLDAVNPPQYDGIFDEYNDVREYAWRHIHETMRDGLFVVWGYNDQRVPRAMEFMVIHKSAMIFLNAERKKKETTQKAIARHIQYIINDGYGAAPSRNLGHQAYKFLNFRYLEKDWNEIIVRAPSEAEEQYAEVLLNKLQEEMTANPRLKLETSPIIQEMLEVFPHRIISSYLLNYMYNLSIPYMPNAVSKEDGNVALSNKYARLVKHVNAEIKKSEKARND